MFDKWLKRKLCFACDTKYFCVKKHGKNSIFQLIRVWLLEEEKLVIKEELLNNIAFHWCNSKECFESCVDDIVKLFVK